MFTVENKENTKPIEIKQSLVEPILGTIILPLIFSLMYFTAFKNSHFAMFLFLGLFLTIVVASLLSYTTIFICDTRMVVKNKLRSIEIVWDDIVSMSTVNYNEVLRYQIKTKDRTISIPVPKNWQEFERCIVAKAKLELEGVGVTPLFVTRTPGIKRWKKIGQEYVNTSFLDWSHGLAYANKRTWKWKAIFGVTSFLVVGIGLLIFFLHDRGVL